MIKREAKFTTHFRHWLKANPRASALFELKQTKGYNLPFRYVKPHQINALLAAKSAEGILFKIPDDSRSVKPCDMFYIRQSEAYVVIKFPEYFMGIDIDVWMKEEKICGRKSITQKRALEICTFFQGC